MSTSPFTPITSNLLARKGDAMPSGAKPSLFWTRPPPLALREPPRPPPPDKPHRMMVTLSAAEFEKLGIAAVKKGLTRHQIVRAALDAHLERLKREYGGCGCMAQPSYSQCGGECTQSCGT